MPFVVDANIYDETALPALFILVSPPSGSSSSSPLIHTRSTIENRKSIQKCPIIEHNIKEITEYNEYKLM